MSRKTKVAIIATVIITGLILSFIAGCSLNPFIRTNPKQTIDLNLINIAFGVIRDKYVEPDKIDGRTLTEGALKGMVDALNDPHSAYLTPAQYLLTESDLGGKFEGIGAYVGTNNGVISIIAPVPGSPADIAGIKVGDLIVEIDGKSTSGMNVNDAVLLIRGPQGTSVKLTVLHKDATETVTIEIVRAEINVPSVIFEMKGTIADININQFGTDTDDDLIQVLETISNNGTTGIILDLRHNPGGYLDTCIAVASHFIEDGVAVTVVDRNGNKDTASVTRTPVKTDLPVVVLVDQYSASASEVLTGALQDHHRAVIAGATTYGKGSVNNLVQLPDGSGIYITIARWLTPNGNLIEGKGIIPDITVDFSKVDGVQWAIDYLNSHK